MFLSAIASAGPAAGLLSRAPRDPLASVVSVQMPVPHAISLACSSVTVVLAHVRLSLHLGDPRPSAGRTVGIWETY